MTRLPTQGPAPPQKITQATKADSEEEKYKISTEDVAQTLFIFNTSLFNAILSQLTFNYKQHNNRIHDLQDLKLSLIHI